MTPVCIEMVRCGLYGTMQCSINIFALVETDLYTVRLVLNGLSIPGTRTSEPKA